ncbi:non-heme iron oxygenase ferredoxin subunit [Arcanobacterium phocisimile]|uniref:Non-heme iron oxygenase ferredoxin subunit n=1 Tax=Arcanobacterium phocisimile TaxID=1302235 RepID=A0ABX7IF03_9ACTO|nr:non-heme iron oxygenase ferredoxin subunit [Arcanobacterium phocisimile]QRV01435.1 non-heme iron oxygenase ferredoxin subunit [Arcanobacterium phocisimile]
MAEYRVCSTTDVAAGSVVGFELHLAEDQKLAVAIIQSEKGNWFATHNQCTHGRVKLSDGWLEEETIECSRHGAVFDLASGDVMSLPATQKLTTYPVRVDGDNVYITV